MKQAAPLFAASLGGYVLSSASLPLWMRALIGLVALGSAALAWRDGSNPRSLQACYIALIATLGSGVLLYGSILANHHFVMLYAALAFALCVGREPDKLQRSCATLIAALMAVAVLQKTFSNSYLDGSYFAYLIDIGALGGPTFSICENCQVAAQQNQDALAQLLARPPTTGELVLMRPLIGGPEFSLAAGRALALGVLLFELWIACAFAFASKHRAGCLSILMFVIGLALFREEWVFASLLSALSFAACPLGAPKVRRALGAASLFFVTLAVIG